MPHLLRIYRERDAWDASRIFSQYDIYSRNEDTSRLDDIFESETQLRVRTQQEKYKARATLVLELCSTQEMYIYFLSLLLVGAYYSLERTPVREGLARNFRVFPMPVKSPSRSASTRAQRSGISLPLTPPPAATTTPLRHPLPPQWLRGVL